MAKLEDTSENVVGTMCGTGVGVAEEATMRQCSKLVEMMGGEVDCTKIKRGRR